MPAYGRQPKSSGTVAAAGGERRGDMCRACRPPCVTTADDKMLTNAPDASTGAGALTPWLRRQWPQCPALSLSSCRGSLRSLRGQAEQRRSSLVAHQIRARSSGIVLTVHFSLASGARPGRRNGAETRAPRQFHHIMVHRPSANPHSDRSATSPARWHRYERQGSSGRADRRGSP